MRKPLLVAVTNLWSITAFFISILLLFSSPRSFAQHHAQLWGVSEFGGQDNAGYIFKYDATANTFTKVAFMNRIASSAVYFNEIFKTDSTWLYAMATQGDSAEVATIVRYNRKTGKLETLYTFNPGLSLPSASLTEYNGKYYGLAWGGQTGPYSYVNGSIFVFDPATNTVTSKFYFDLVGKDYGRWPRGKLFLYNNKLYGTSDYGGAYDDGVLFEFDPLTNNMVKKADFQLAVTGRFADSFLQLYNGKLYGICYVGGANNSGAVFEYDLATGVLNKSFDLTYKTNAGKPVFLNDKLYIPSDPNYGIIEINLAQKSSNLLTPVIDNGYLHFGRTSPLYYNNGVLYGISSNDVYNGDSSFVFAWTPGASKATAIAEFKLGTIGRQFSGPLTQADGKLYGFTDYAGVHGLGSLFEVDPVAKTAVAKASFGNGLNGYQFTNAGSNLLYMDSVFYGTTPEGGYYGEGLLYCFDPVTKKATHIKDFVSSNYLSTEGSYPTGNLVSNKPNDNQFFGLTATAATYANGLAYHYYKPTNTITFAEPLTESNPRLYQHGIPYSYATMGIVYKATTYNGSAEMPGLFNAYPTNGTTQWTRVFTFPAGMLPQNDAAIWA